MRRLIALTEQDIGDPLKGIGPLGLEGGEDAPSVFNQMISTAIGIMTVIGIVWFVFLMLVGAFAIMNAGGDKAKLEEGRNKILNGVTGLGLVIAAVFIVDFVGSLIGIENILNPGELINQITGN